MSNLQKAQDALDEKALEAAARVAAGNVTEGQMAANPDEAEEARQLARDVIAAYESAKPALPAPDCGKLIARIEARDRWEPPVGAIPPHVTPPDPVPASEIITTLESLSRQLNEANAKIRELEPPEELFTRKFVDEISSALSAERSRAEAAEARIALLRKHAVHTKWCAYEMFKGGACSCGLDVALSSLPTVGEKWEAPRTRVDREGGFNAARMAYPEEMPSPNLITDAAKGDLPADWLHKELASIDGEIAKWPEGMRASLDAAMKASPAKGDDDADGAYELGKRDGYEEAVADIDRLTGGDGEYRYCTDHDPDRHTPDVATMKQRIADRFALIDPPSFEERVEHNAD